MTHTRDELGELEGFAVDLARASGEVIVGSVSSPRNVRYKKRAAGRPRDPVTDVDLRLERDLRDAIARRCPRDGLLGEELPFVPPKEQGRVWAIDPIDGTTNFVHGMPLVTVSVACLERGVPLVGAVWCSATHLFRAGVYHARRGDVLRLDGETVQVHRPEQAVGLFGVAGSASSPDVAYDLRTTGSAALDCALTAAGALRAARLARLHVWDVAAGALLVEAAGGRVIVEHEGRRSPFESFDGPLADWHRALWIGEPEVLDEVLGVW